MATPQTPLSARLYSALLRLLPFDFRRDYGSDMEETFREQHDATARDRGQMGLLRMWWTTVVDIFRMAPREHLSVFAQDSRYAVRMMLRNPGFTFTAVLILGLGIGVNTSIFSLVNSVLLKPLPYLEGNRIVVLRQPAVKLGSENIRFSPPELADYRKQSQTLDEIVEYHSMTFTLFGGDEPHRVQTGVVSAGFFEALGIKPLLGRTFLPGDETASAQPVLVLSYEFWKRVEGGAANIIGKTYQMNDRPHIVIGVLPSIPQYPNENDVYMPSTSCPFRSNPRTEVNRNAHMLQLFARLKPGQTPDLCTREVKTIVTRMTQDYPKFYPDRLGVTANSTYLREDLTKQARPLLLALIGAAAFVLLIGCANVANLILARMARREHELVIRTAVGAGAGRILRQLLTENLVMALSAAAIGILFAFASMHSIAKVAGQLTPRAREVAVDGWVLAFAILTATATTLIFGSVAALYSRRDMASGLKEARGGTGERGRNLLRSGLIAAQVAFSFVLLIGAGLMVRSFIRLNQVSPGFIPQRVFAASFDTNWSTVNGNERAIAVTNRLLHSLETQPGVLSAAVSSSFPMDPDLRVFDGRPQQFQVEGDPKDESEASTVRSVRVITPDYFKVLGIPLVAGRVFRGTDREDSPSVVIINRALALKRWGNQDPIGKRISFNNGTRWNQIVGIVGDVREFSPDRDAPFQVYYPMPQNPAPGAVVVRTAGDPGTMAGLIRKAIHDADPGNAIVAFETLEQARDVTMESPRGITRMFSLFAVLAFVIAVAGIASMLALWVRQRTREIGIRIALGASGQAILGSIVRQGMLLVGIGLAVGVVGAYELTGILKKLLFQVEPTDLPTYTIVSLFLLAAALFACYLPARRAARIDPQIALRCD